MRSRGPLKELKDSKLILNEFLTSYWFEEYPQVSIKRTSSLNRDLRVGDLKELKDSKLILNESKLFP